MKRLSGAVFALLLAACGREAAADRAAVPTPVAQKPSPSPPAQPPPTPPDDWSGRWIGPEGLFLLIEEAGEGEYRLTLKDNLDSQAEYDAEAVEGGLQFVRAGQSIVIRKGTGAQTGFKWLADKKDCLIVVAQQEGYCRD